MVQLNWRELAKMLFDEIERTRAQLVSLRPVLTTRREESTSRMGPMRGVPTPWNAYKAATTQAVQLGVEVKVDNREPRSPEVRRKSQDRSWRAGTSQGPPKADRRSGSKRASVRMRVLLDRQRPRTTGRLWACVPSSFPMAVHSLS
jgi:hypothetical protein